MEDKKEIRVRLSTVISMFVIFILIIALGVTYYFGFVADKNENIGDEKVTNTTENVATENKTEKEDIKKEENIVADKEGNNKLNEQKCKENFQKYLDIGSTFASNSLDILRELDFIDEYPNPDDYEGIKYNDAKYTDMNYFLKTDIKYADYKEKMLQYMTFDCMEKNFDDYTRNNNGYLYVVSYGGTASNPKIQEMEKSSSNEYNIKVAIRADDDGSTGFEIFIVTFDKNNKVNNVRVKEYDMIDSELKNKELFYVTDVIDNSSSDNTYTLKGVIYNEYTITKNELTQYLKEEKMEVNGEEYLIQENENGEYSLVHAKNNVEHYSIKKRNNTTYYLESDTEFSTVYKLTDNYKEIILDSDVKCEYGEHEIVKTTVGKYFKNFESKEPVDTTNPSGVFKFEFNKNGVCKKIIECVTGH